MALLTRKRLLLAKTESNYGQSAAPDGTNAMLVSNLEVSPLEIELLDRELITPYLGNTEKVVGQRMVQVNFDVELAGSGTAGTAPQWGPVMKACGFAEALVGASPGPASVTYTPVSSSFSSVTLDFNADGNKHLVTGCRGTATINLNAGEIPKISFQMMGIYNAVTAASAVTPTFANQADPVVVNSVNTTSVSAFSFSACLESFSLDLANETPFRQLAGCTQQVLITQRAPSGEISIEAPIVGSGAGQKDFFAAVSAQTLGAITWQHGQTAGNIITFNAPTCNLDSPSYADSDGVMMLNLPYMPIPSSSGNDEFTLVLT
jgi:hypothetical protein